MCTERPDNLACEIKMFQERKYRHRHRSPVIGVLKFGSFRKMLIFKGIQHNTRFFSFLLNMPHDIIIKYVSEANEYLDCMSYHTSKT
jgi:hypothetical protein